MPVSVSQNRKSKIFYNLKMLVVLPACHIVSAVVSGGVLLSLLLHDASTIMPQIRMATSLLCTLLIE